MAPKRQSPKPKGGKRPGAGRPRNPDTFMQIIGCKAIAGNAPPHDVLAAIARGQPMTAQYFDKATGQPVGLPFEHYPTWDQRIRAAEIAAPYHAGKVVSIQGFQHFGAGGGSPNEVDAESLSEDDIDQQLAALERADADEAAASPATDKAAQGKAGASARSPRPPGIHIGRKA